MGCLFCVGVERKLCVDGLFGGDVDGREPTEAVGLEAVGDAEELFPQLFGEGPGVAVADEDAVDGADGGDLGGGAHEEDFVGDVDHLTRDALLDDGDADVAGEGEDGVAGDA